MKILIVGTGAQGSVIATELAEKGIIIYEKVERHLA
jgi:ketopantoate reductase